MVRRPLRILLAAAAALLAPSVPADAQQHRRGPDPGLAQERRIGIRRGSRLQS